VLGDNGDTLASRLELDDAVHESVQSVVLGPANVATGMIAGAALTDQNTAGAYRLVAIHFDS
jgi:hypothetical protein